MKGTSLTRRDFLVRSGALVGAASGLSAALASCTAQPSSSSSGSGSGGSGKKQVTLTVMYNNNELTPAYISQFEKANPDIKISFIEFDQTRLNSMIAAGSPPDFIRGGAIGSANVNARGLALNLNPYLKKSSVLKMEDLQPINNSWRWDGKHSGSGPFYGITKDWSQDGTLWYNSRLLDAAGVSVPSSTQPLSYDQLLDIATKVTQTKNGTTQVYGFGPEWAWSVWAPLTMMIMQQGGSFYSNKDRSQTDLTTKPAMNALQWYVNFLQAGVGPSVLDPLAAGQDAPSFEAGQMGVSQDGYWFGGQFLPAYLNNAQQSQDMQQNARMAPAPQMGNHRISPSWAGIGAWISAKTKYPDQAWRLMEYFMAGQPAHDRAKSGWGIPSLKSLFGQMPKSPDYEKQAYACCQDELKYFELMPDTPYAQGSAFDTVLNQYLPQVAKKQLSLASAADQMTTAINKVLTQGKQELG